LTNIKKSKKKYIATIILSSFLLIYLLLFINNDAENYTTDNKNNTNNSYTPEIENRNKKEVLGVSAPQTLSNLPSILRQLRGNENTNQESLDRTSQNEIQNANINQVFYRDTNTGTIRRINVLPRGDNSIEIIDISNYENELAAFRWTSGDFKYGISNQKSIPELQKIEISDEIDPNMADTLVSDLISLENNKYLFIQTLNPVSNLEIDFITGEKGTVGSISTTAYHSSGAKYSSLGIIPREQWSGDPDINNPNRLTWDPVYYKVNKIVIHHTATANYQDPTYWMRAIYNYHAYSCGWGDIGYNYLIDQYGNIYEGKLGGDEAKGYHAGSANANSIGISIIGTFTDIAPTSAAQDALKRLIAEKSAFYNFTPAWHSTVYGHRDFMSTACPGNAFYSILPLITSNANSYKNSNFSQLKSIVQKVNQNVDNGNFESDKLILIFNQSSNISIPSWSGIESYTTLDNVVTLNITSSSTPYEDVNERIKSLYTIFSMYNNVDYVGLNHMGEIH